MKFIILFLLLIILFSIKDKNEPFQNLTKLMFIHIPKTAGTSIEAYGKKNNINWGRHIKYPTPKKKINCPYWHIPPKYFKDSSNPYKEKKLFAVIRNPYDRIISEYKYRNELFNKNKKTVDKKSLNKFIHKTENIIKKNKFCFDGHLIPQYEFIDDNTEVLRIENLDKEFPELMKKYNYPVEKLGNSFKTSLRVTKEDLDKKSIDIINRIYQKDFERFGYKKIVK